MALHRPPAFVVRALRMSLLIAPVAAVVVVAGCGHHRRSAMRPVYSAPVVVPAAPAPDCTPGTAGCPPATVTGPIESGTPLPAPSADPNVSPSGVNGEPPLREGLPGTGESPPIDAPKASLRTRRGAPARLTGRADLKAKVRPYVNDPDNLFLPPKADRPWRYVVLHHSAHDTGGYAQIDREHRKKLGTDGCGYHFVIGNGSDSPDGRIEVAGRWADQKPGAHCRNARDPGVNQDGIGICLVGDLDHSPPTPKQVAAARALVAYLRDRYQIPAANVGTHAVVAQAPTACPGKKFPAEAILGTRSLVLR